MRMQTARLDGPCWLTLYAKMAGFLALHLRHDRRLLSALDRMTGNAQQKPVFRGQALALLILRFHRVLLDVVNLEAEYDCAAALTPEASRDLRPACDFRANVTGKLLTVSHV